MISYKERSYYGGYSVGGLMFILMGWIEIDTTSMMFESDITMIGMTILILFINLFTTPVYIGHMCRTYLEIVGKIGSNKSVFKEKKTKTQHMYEGFMDMIINKKKDNQDIENFESKPAIYNNMRSNNHIK